MLSNVPDDKKLWRSSLMSANVESFGYCNDEERGKMWKCTMNCRIWWVINSLNVIFIYITLLNDIRVWFLDIVLNNTLFVFVVIHKFSGDARIYFSQILTILCQKFTPTLFSVRNLHVSFNQNIIKCWNREICRSYFSSFPM